MTMSAPIVSVTEGLQQLSQRDLYLMYERWIGGMPPARDAELVSNLVLQMSNPFAVAEGFDICSTKFETSSASRAGGIPPIQRSYIKYKSRWLNCCKPSVTLTIGADIVIV